MNRHGIVVPREDFRAQCMGPGACPECDKDMADATADQVHEYLIKEFGRRWSLPNSDLSDLVKWVLRCGMCMEHAYDGDQVRPLTMSIPLPEASKELQFLAALSHVHDHFLDTAGVDTDAIARGCLWLSSRYAR